jgi:hypothetical protein
MVEQIVGEQVVRSDGRVTRNNELRWRVELAEATANK